MGLSAREQSERLAPLALAQRDAAGLMLVWSDGAWQRRHFVDVREQLLAGATLDFTGPPGAPAAETAPPRARTANPTRTDEDDGSRF